MPAGNNGAGRMRGDWEASAPNTARWIIDVTSWE
jgi:hypothetical protein